MARIYYDKKKLYGKPFKSATLNINSFKYIFENTIIEKNFPKKIEFTNSKKEIFKTLLLYTDDIEYDSSKRKVYIPNSIIFYDYEDYNFPTEFYFIVRIENQIEIRKCNGGEDIKWFHIPDMHKPVYDLRIITKIEATFSELIKLVEENLKREKNSNKKVNIKKERPSINSIQREAYKELTEICVLNKKECVLNHIGNLKNYDNDSEYFTTLNYLIDLLEEDDISFIIRLDWKADIKDLEWFLKSTLKDNFNLSIDLPSPNNYKKNASVSFDNVFEDFDKPLRQNNLQLGFIDTQSDEYVFILHKITDKKRIQKLIKLIGYNYYEK